MNSVPETIQKEEKKIKLEPKKEEAIPQTLETSKDNNLTKEQPQDHSSNGFYGGLVAIAVIIIIGGACMLIEYEKEASFGIIRY